MSNRDDMFEEEQYVDVRSLPLKPPQPALPPGKPVRRPWHPVVWDDSFAGIQTPQIHINDDDKERRPQSKEYPHKQRIRNLKRLIAEGKIKPSSETVIFFLCNKFAISKERQSQLPIN